MPLVFKPISYTNSVKRWLGESGHYLQNPPPGCLYAVGVYEGQAGLFGEPVASGPLLGLCLVSRPVARMLPQDGSVGEITRFVLLQGLPYGTASQVLRYAAEVARTRGMEALISYHDRTKHTGTIYKKAGFRKDGTTTPPKGDGWASRNRSESATSNQVTSKRRWRLAL